ncbi:MAG TPA: hypothetical protein VKB49_17860 [Candidatus Sulfotelmatobacter sp.]|nr:hypothetical protein [Candidatus Sulfotelmatobacter sp.]
MRRSQKTPLIKHKITVSHAPHLRCSSVIEDFGAVGRGLSVIAFLSHIKPPKSHPTPAKISMERMASDYNPVIPEKSSSQFP